MGKRPELKGPPELFYSETEAKKYSCSSRYIQIQRELAFRAYELLALPLRDEDNNADNFENKMEESLFSPKPCISSLILDIGVGSGMCAAILGEQRHQWIGLDISKPMLDVSRCRMVTNDTFLSINPKKNSDQDEVFPDLKNRAGAYKQNANLLNSSSSDMEGKSEDSAVSELEELFDSSSSDIENDDDDNSDARLLGGDLILGDMGDGLGFRPGSFDGAISISALQWLCNADTANANPRRRLNRLFTTLYSVLRIGAKAVFQFYPESPIQVEMILNAALKVGFNGGMVIDFPNTPRRKKYFLVLMVGSSGNGIYHNHRLSSSELPPAKEKDFYKSKQQFIKKKGKNAKDRTWVLRKKELRRKRGFTDVPEDTKYTARKRGPRF